MFERFLATKFPASKRFGLEGIESIIPALQLFCQEAAGQGVTQLQIGMAHRGRLNVLHNLLGKPFGEVCAEMEGRQSSFRVGDVKYHLGHTVDRRLCGGGGMKISVAPNPSHLEMIHPVVQGLVRSLQRHRCRPLHCLACTQPHLHSVSSVFTATNSSVTAARCTGCGGGGACCTAADIPLHASAIPCEEHMRGRAAPEPLALYTEDPTWSSHSRC